LTADPGQEKEQNDERWREAASLRAQFRGWVVIWLAAENCFRAYPRSSTARRAIGLTAPSSADMAELIKHADASRTRKTRT
jgi:hypothetical protein